MTAQGTAATRYRRAIETRSVFLAEHAAREMGHVPLVDVLGLLELYAPGEPAKYERAAVRWLGRLALPDLSVCDFHLAVAALQALPRLPTSRRLLEELAKAGAAR